VANIELIEAVDNVFLVQGTDVNWVVLRDGKDLTLIDTGWLGDRPVLEHSIRMLGSRPQDVAAILLTHAHIDHMGAVNYFHDQYRTPLYMDQVEVAHAQRHRLEQAGPALVAKNIWRPGVLPWAMRVRRVGALEHIKASHALPFPSSGALDLPGNPVPVPLHGHTSGHCAFALPQSGAVATGDGLVTGHPVSGHDGPHLLTMFDHDQRAAHAALSALESLDGETVLPGHGPLWRGGIRRAVELARDHAGH
jgi:glyoxylase-like metal-dependent hydrolase (beta-lactamase superfamily II)